VSVEGGGGAVSVFVVSVFGGGAVVSVAGGGASVDVVSVGGCC